jgi:aspartokinase
LAKSQIQLHGLASSPSAMSAVLFSSDTEKAIEVLFDPFEFPTYGSPPEWHAAYRDKELLHKEIVASYQEQVITIYGIVHQSDLDLWSTALPISEPDRVGVALTAIGQGGVKMPFLLAQPDLEDRLLFAFCFPRSDHEQVKRILSIHAPNVILHHIAVAALFIHGPHFGDRYGIASTLMRTLESAGVSILALSCAVSSISTVIRQDDLHTALQALNDAFKIPRPGSKSPDRSSQ